MNKYLTKIFSISIFGLLFTISSLYICAPGVYAATRTATVTGNWDATATWGGNPVPVAGDNIIINSGVIVTVNVTTAVVTTCVINAPAANNGITISGTNTLNCGVITMTMPGANFNSTIAVGTGTLNATSIAIYGGGPGASRYNLVSVSTGTINVTGNITFGNTAAQARLTFTDTGTLNLGGTLGTGGTFTAGTGTVNLNGAAQTVAPYIFNNLTVSGTGAKTFATTPTVNGILSMENTGTVTVTTGVVTYGTNATLQYNKSEAYTATTKEWISPFIATGGIIIENSGAITTPGAVRIGNNTSVPLNINGGTLTPGANRITLHGDFINTGTLTSGSGGVSIEGTTATQSIAGFTTTGNVSMTKTAGAVTFTGNVNAGSLTTNGSGGTINFGTGLTHTFSAGVGNNAWVRTNGAINLQSSTLRLDGNVNGSGGTWATNTGTVEYYSAGNQVCASFGPMVYNNLILSGSGAKSFGNAFNVNGVLSMQGTVTATITNGVTYGASATLQYQTTDARNQGPEWITPFVATGGIVIDTSSATITLNAAKTIANGSNLNLKSGILAAGTNLTMASTSTINRSEGTMTGTPQGTGVYNVNFTGNSKTAGACLSGSGLNNITATLTSGQTLTLDQNRAPDGDVTINTGSTFDLSTFTLNRSAAGGTLTVAGTLLLGGTSGGQTGNNFPASFNTLTMTGGTVNYNNAAGGQTVYSTPTYTNLTLGNTSGASTAEGTLTVNGTLTTTSGGTLNMVANQLLGTLSTVTNGGTIRTQNTGSTPVPSGKTWGGTVQYDAASGSQTARTGTYNNLTLSNTSGTDTADGDLTVNATLTTTSGGTLNMSAYTLGVSAVTNSGTIRTQNTSSAPLTTGKTWAGTVQYDATTGGQTVMTGTYTNLTLSNTSGASTAEGNLTVNGTLTTTPGGTLGMSTNQLLGTLTTITNNGTIRTMNTSSTPIPTGKTWGGTVNYNADIGSQTVMTGTYNNLTLANTSGASTAEGNLTVNGTLTTTAGGTLGMSTNQLLGSLTTITNNGTIRTKNTSSTPIPTGKTWGGTVNYNADTGGQTVMTGTYGILTMGNTSGTQTAGGNLTVTTLNNNTNAADILDMSTYTLAVTTPNNTGTIKTQNTSSTPLSSGLTWGGTVEYAAGSAQTVVTGTYNDLTFSGAGAKTTASGTVTVNSNWSVTGGAATLSTNNTVVTVTGNITGSGSITSGSGTISLAGNWTNNGTFTCDSGTVNYSNTAGGQTVQGLTYNNLTLSNTGGTDNANGALTVNGTFTTTAGGTLNMATNALSVSTVSHAGILTTQNTTSTPLTAGKTWGGTVNYNAATGGQTVAAGTYGILTMGNTSGTQTAGGNLTATTLNNNTNAADILDMAAYTLAATTPNNTGTIRTQNTSSTPISTGKTWGGTVQYDAAGAQTVSAATSYNNLTLAGSGSKTLTGVSAIGGNLALSGTAIATAESGMTIGGNVSIGSGTTFGGGTALAHNVAGNWTNSGTFNAGTSTVTFNGAAQQTLSGTMTGSSAFYNLTLTNASGADDPGQGVSFTPGIIFASDATATNNYTIITPSVRVQYNSGSTYTFNNINWNGQASGTRIYFRNSDLGSGTWLLKVSGTQTAVSCVDVARSDASGGNTIYANDGTDTDSQNNTNWDFGINPGFFLLFD